MFRNSVTVNLANFLRKTENPECTTQDAEPRRILSGAVMWFWTVNSQLICETLYMAPQQITPGEKKNFQCNQSVNRVSLVLFNAPTPQMTHLWDPCTKPLCSCDSLKKVTHHPKVSIQPGLKN